MSRNKSTIIIPENQPALFTPQETLTAPELIAQGGDGWQPFELQRQITDDRKRRCSTTVGGLAQTAF